MTDKDKELDDFFEEPKVNEYDIEDLEITEEDQKQIEQMFQEEFKKEVRKNLGIKP